MKDYKLKIGSKTVYLVDPNPKETVNSFLESLPTKEAPWVQKDEHDKIRYFAICPYCNNPITLVGYETRNNLSPKPYMKHYPHSVRKLAEYNEGNYNKCILASKNLSSFGNTDKKRVQTDDISIGILNTVKTQLDRIFYILTQDTGIHFSKKLKKEMFKDYMAADGYNYSSSYVNNLPWTFANVIRAQNLIYQFIDERSPLGQALAKCNDISLQKVENLSPFLSPFIKQITPKNTFLLLKFEFRRLRIDKESGEQSICFRAYKKGKEIDKIDLLYEETIQINLTRFPKLIQKERDEKKEDDWLKLKQVIGELIN